MRLEIRLRELESQAPFRQRLVDDRWPRERSERMWANPEACDLLVEATALISPDGNREEADVPLAQLCELIPEHPPQEDA